MDLTSYIENCYTVVPELKGHKNPWSIIISLDSFIELKLTKLPKNQFNIKNKVTVHKSAQIENGATIKENSIIGKNCIVKAGAYLRNGVYLEQDVVIGANCEIK